MAQRKVYITKVGSSVQMTFYLHVYVYVLPFFQKLSLILKYKTELTCLGINHVNSNFYNNEANSRVLIGELYCR